MIQTRYALRLALLLVITLGMTAGNAAAKGQGPGTKAVRSANETISAQLKTKVAADSGEEKALTAKVTESLRGFLDIDALGKSALSKHWETIPEAQRTEFLTLLRALIEAKYVEGLRANLEYQVLYLGESSKAGGKLLVKTEISATRRGRPYKIAVDYKLAPSGKRWHAIDVVTDGVGLVENYRAQFNSIISKKGFDGLLTLMRKRHNKAK